MWTILLKAAAGVSTVWTLTAFGLVVLTLLAVYKQSKNTALRIVAIVGALILVLAAILGYFHQHSVYEVRVVVLDLQQVPVESAKVTSSLGGEAKKISGGWQFDIPVASVPANQKLTVYAALGAAFLQGQNQITLGADFHPDITINLAHAETTVRGIVTDEGGRALEGVNVGVVGYGGETVRTKADGGFQLSAHAADGQFVQLHAEKSGFLPGGGWHPAGTAPAEVVLRRQ